MCDCVVIVSKWDSSSTRRTLPSILLVAVSEIGWCKQNNIIVLGFFSRGCIPAGFGFIILHFYSKCLST